MASKRLSGAGASFPSKIYTRWFFDLAKSGGPRVNYQAVGSGSGRKAFIDETVNFGASDDPMKDSDIVKVLSPVCWELLSVQTGFRMESLSVNICQQSESSSVRLRSSQDEAFSLGIVEELLFQ